MHRTAAGTPAVVEVGSFAQKRSGPIVASGCRTDHGQRSEFVAGSVHYDADVTWNENTFFDKKNNVANLLWNVVMLCGVLMGITIAAGFAFGGVRVALQRLLAATKSKVPRMISSPYISMRAVREAAGSESTFRPGRRSVTEVQRRGKYLN